MNSITATPCRAFRANMIGVPTPMFCQTPAQYQHESFASSPWINSQEDLAPVIDVSYVEQTFTDSDHTQTPINNSSTPDSQTSTLIQIHRPHDGSIDVPVKLFVGRFPRSMNDSELEVVFEKFGALDECVILRDADKNSKGCAFVRYRQISSAVNAISSLNNRHVIDPSIGTIQVQFANGEVERLDLRSEQIELPPVKLFVGSLSKTVGPEQLRSIFQEYGEVVEVFILTDERGDSRGSGFVKMKDKREAAKAILGLNEKFYFSDCVGKPIEVRIACSKLQKTRMHYPTVNLLPTRELPPPPQTVVPTRPLYISQALFSEPQHQTQPTQYTAPQYQETEISQNVNLYIGIPERWGEVEVREFFGPFGRINSVTVVREKRTGRSKGYGFISFASPHGAHLAKIHANGVVQEGFRLRVENRHGDLTYYPDTLNYPHEDMPSSPYIELPDLNRSMSAVSSAPVSPHAMYMMMMPEYYRSSTPPTASNTPERMSLKHLSHHSIPQYQM